MKNKFVINLVLGFVKITGFLPLLIFFKPKIHKSNKQKSKLPKCCILVSNHKSLLDFPLYLLVFPFRTIRFLMAEVLYNKSPFFAWFLNSLGGIRVDRDDKSFSFVSDSIEVLDNKGILGVFPEGRLPVNGKPWPFTVSTAFIATHADAPIVPIYTDGNYGISKRVNVVIGEPFFLTDFAEDGLNDEQQLAHLTDVLEKRVYDLKSLLKKGKDQNAK